jgi:SAM-dependent methyltransferase
MHEQLEDIRATYDTVAIEYAAEYEHDLDDKVLDRALLTAFTELVRRNTDVVTPRVGDLGCGPGHEARHLVGLGLAVDGVDLSPRMIDEATRRHGELPGLRFQVGSLLALPFADADLAGAIAIYSIIHLDRAGRQQACRELARVVTPGGTVLLSVHTSADGFPPGSVRRMDSWWGHSVQLDGYFLDADEVAADLGAAGLDITARLTRGPASPREFASQRVYFLATRR